MPKRKAPSVSSVVGLGREHVNSNYQVEVSGSGSDLLNGHALYLVFKHQRSYTNAAREITKCCHPDVTLKVIR